MIQFRMPLASASSLFLRFGSATPQGLPSGPTPDSVHVCGNMIGANLPHSAVSPPLSRGTKLVPYHSKHCTSNSARGLYTGRGRAPGPRHSAS